MKETSFKIQNWASIILFILCVAMLLATYFDVFIPSPLFSFNLALLSIGLFAVYLYRKEGNKKREVILLFTTLSYVNLMISGFLYKIWTYEAILTKLGFTRLSIILFLLVSVYLSLAFIRARITYKQVKGGNQRHNQMWKVSKKELKRMKKSQDIYINLGQYYEGKDD